MWKATTLDLGSGRSLHAVQKGAGADVLLVHGAMTTHHDWLAGPARALAGEARVTAIDRPGHGLSRRPRFVGTPRDQAGQIAAGLDRLGVGPAVVVGHSFGALPDGRLTEIEGAGHMLHHSHPDPVLRAVREAVSFVAA